MRKTFLFLGIIALAFTLSACTNVEKNSVNKTTNFSNEQEEGEEVNIESGTYSANAETSSLKWLGERIVGSSHSGSVDIKSGNFIVEDNKISSGEFILDMTSISDSEGSERLEDHLKSEDFFMVSEYPEAKLRINSSNMLSSNSNEEIVLEMKADLIIKGIANPVEFTTTLKEENDILLASSEFSIDRTKWDIKYDSGNFFEDLGDRAIKDQIYFNIIVTANNK